MENRVAKPEKSNGGSYLEEQNRRKSKKPRWIPVFLITLVFCAAVGCFAGPRIWAKNQRASINSLPEESQLQNEVSEVVSSEEQNDNLQETETSIIVESSIPGTEPEQRNIAATKEQVDIFESPRIGSHIMTQLNAGEEVEILQVKSFDTVNWAYVSSSTRKVMGWIVTDMLDMYEMQLSADEINGTGSDSGTTPAGFQYGVITASEINIRSSPSQSAEHIGVYVYGDRITILETNNGWARTDRGWVNLSYVYVDGEIGLNVAYGTVISDLLTVHSGPGSNYNIVNTLNLNDRVQILEQIVLGDIPWGYISGGWVSLNCIQLSSSGQDLAVHSTSETASIYRQATVVCTNTVNVRSGAGTNYPVVGSLKNGSIIRVYETATSLGVNWARIDNGWVCTDYVSMNPM